jgi:hypothetical protein
MNIIRMNGASRRSIQPIVIGFSVLLAFVGDASHVVQAQAYCAMYDDGSKNCGIPTLDSCRQSISGVGGYCAPDQTSQMRPDLFERPRLFPDLQNSVPPATSPQDPNWMPPPPGE